MVWRGVYDDLKYEQNTAVGTSSKLSELPYLLPILCARFEPFLVEHLHFGLPSNSFLLARV